MNYKELSQLLGISRAQLDRVLNNRANVSETTRKEILAKIEEIGFKPNSVGKALALQRKMSFGIILSSDLSATGTHIYSRIHEGMMIAAEQMQNRGAKFEFRHLKSGQGQEQAEVIREMVADGHKAIALSREDLSDELTEAIDEAMKQGVKFVYYSNRNAIRNPAPQYAYVLASDNRTEGLMAAKLMDKFLNGNGKVVLISGLTKNRIHQARIDSAQEFIEKNNRSRLSISAIYRDVYPQQTARDIAKRILQRHPDVNGVVISCGHSVDMAEILSARSGGGKIRIIAFDFTEKGERCLETNQLDALIGVDLRKVGYDTIKAIYDFTLGGTVEPLEVMPVIQIKLSEK